jgi:hypothetical protein
MLTEFLLPCDPAPPIVLKGISDIRNNDSVQMIAVRPVTAAQWLSVMGQECKTLGDNPGFAVHLSWLQTKEFCRRLTAKQREALDSLGRSLAVNLPTFQQWESTLATIQSEIVIHRLPRSKEGGEPAMITSSSEGAFEFVDGLDELCLDALPDNYKYEKEEIGTFVQPKLQQSGPLSATSNACKLRQMEDKWYGILKANIRDVRGLRIDRDSSKLFLHRLYCGVGYGSKFQHRGKVAGFRVAVHSIASQIATDVSPKIKKSIWGKIVVKDIGKFKDVKIFPGGAREWDWVETNTRHNPGIGIAEVMELIEFGATEIVLGCGYHNKLQVTSELRTELASRGIKATALNTEDAINTYNSLSNSGVSVGALIHTTC